jgi:hypothetical protein
MWQVVSDTFSLPAVVTRESLPHRARLDAQIDRLRPEPGRGWQEPDALPRA